MPFRPTCRPVGLYCPLPWRFQGKLLSPEVQMYNKPTLVRFGTFREVTQGGPINLAIDLAADNLRELFFHETPTAS